MNTFSQVGPLKVENYSDYRVWVRGYASDPTCTSIAVTGWIALNPYSCGTWQGGLIPIMPSSYRWSMCEVLWEDPANIGTPSFCPGWYPPYSDSWTIVSSPFAGCPILYPGPTFVPVSCNIPTGCGGSPAPVGANFITPDHVAIN